MLARKSIRCSNITQQRRNRRCAVASPEFALSAKLAACFEYGSSQVPRKPIDEGFSHRPRPMRSTSAGATGNAPSRSSLSTHSLHSGDMQSGDNHRSRTHRDLLSGVGICLPDRQVPMIFRKIPAARFFPLQIGKQLFLDSRCASGRRRVVVVDNDAITPTMVPASVETGPEYLIFNFL